MKIITLLSAAAFILASDVHASGIATPDTTDFGSMRKLPEQSHEFMAFLKKHEDKADNRIATYENEAERAMVSAVLQKHLDAEKEMPAAEAK